MIDHVAAQLALRAYAKTLVVATTGVMSLSATATGYARTSGSFLDDGFAVGMEVTPSGFPQTTRATITDVDVLTMTVKGGRTVAATASGRSLTAGLPSRRAWEGVPLTPEPGEPWVFERYTAGPQSQLTIGALGDLEDLPMWELLVYVPAGSGLTARRYGDALRRLFAPRRTIALGGGIALEVRTDQAPQVGRLFETDTGFEVAPFTAWFRVDAPNLI